MNACDTLGHMAHYYREARRGRRTAAPAGLMMSLALHLAIVLVVMMVWKPHAPVTLTEVTLVDAAPTAAGKRQEPPPPPQAVARARPETKAPLHEAVSEKSPARPVTKPVTPPVKAAKPVTVETPAPPDAVQVTQEAASPVQVDAVSDIAAVHAPVAEPHVGVPAEEPVSVSGSAAEAATAAESVGPGIKDTVSLERAYTDRLKELIERRIKYPLFARRARLEGTCMVSCRLMRTGEVLGVEITKSTGHVLLDRAALKAVSDTGSFPPPPSSICNGELDVKVPVTFSLTGR